jgi:predicted patatin/cPLA2 family phospholipase
MKKALVLEGGGSRGVYTAGVLEVLHQENFSFNYVIGTSMGACNGSSFVSNQPKRNKRVIVDYINDERYFNYSGLIKSDVSVFGMDFLFNTIPNELDPFDYDTFIESSTTFKAVATDLYSGEATYFSKSEMNTKDEIMKMIKASSSLPGLALPVEFKGSKYLDGGVTDSVPIQKAIADGSDKIIVVLTRDASYNKKPLKGRLLQKIKFKEYPKFLEALFNRHNEYNETLKLIEKLEKKGKIMVIRPSKPINISKFEKNLETFDEIFNLGKKDVKNKLNNIREYLKD